MDNKLKERLVSAGAGAAILGLVGAQKGHGLGSSTAHKEKNRKDREARVRRWTLGGAALGTVAGGLTGYLGVKRAQNMRDRFQRDYQKQRYYESGGTGDWNYQHYKPKQGGVDQHLKFMGLGKDVTHKKQVTDRLRELVKKHHPDAPGGNHKKMQDVNNAYDSIKKSEWFSKLAFVRGFMKVAGV